MSSSLSLQFDADAIRPLVQQIVAEVLGQVAADQAKLGGRLAYSEAEAAQLLSLHSHQLRDERRRGRIQASVGPGKKVLYSQGDLLAYLSSRRWQGGGE